MAESNAHSTLRTDRTEVICPMFIRIFFPFHVVGWASTSRAAQRILNEPDDGKRDEIASRRCETRHRTLWDAVAQFILTRSQMSTMETIASRDNNDTAATGLLSLLCKRAYPAGGHWQFPFAMLQYGILAIVVGFAALICSTALA
ncbi:hypothetical protein B0T22DRAFT_436290 [Podospora appendiculata]|uniref:Uncharacterized protein n=1 Tax=Podospora appendiculata TaxID=314037 RepID=A0AAE0XGP9_9PEZI|nr:hypothetical protein B0T22DRAFT_436290 [Podospora appendiculata]